MKNMEARAAPRQPVRGTTPDVTLARRNPRLTHEAIEAAKAAIGGD
jgi:hypothetical protein